MMILFKCNNPDCSNSIKKYFKLAKAIPPFLDCGDCGVGKLERTLFAPSSRSTQIVDNGTQARQVEVDSNIVEKEIDRLNNE